MNSMIIKITAFIWDSTLSNIVLSILHVSSLILIISFNLGIIISVVHVKLRKVMEHNKKQYLTFIGSLPYARHCSKSFTYIL